MIIYIVYLRADDIFLPHRDIYIANFQGLNYNLIN